MRSTGKQFLVPILLLFAIGATAQTTTNDGRAAVSQASPTAGSATAQPAQWNGPTALFMSRLQSNGLLDHAFMKTVKGDLNLTEVAGEPLKFCSGFPGQPDGCTGGLVCCDCIFPHPACETVAQCQVDCTK